MALRTTPIGIHMFRIPPGEDLFGWLKDYCTLHDIRLGAVGIIGAIRSPKLGCFDFAAGRYITLDLAGDWEVLNITGNISRRLNESWPHIHAMLAGPDFKVVGGHLFAAEVIVAEVVLHVFDSTGGDLERREDAASGGLWLWPAEER